MTNFIAFPSIEAFRKIVADVRKNCDYHGKMYPILEYVGRVKLHGTNAGIRFVNGELYPQSRSRELSIGDDNAGFAAWVLKNKKILSDLILPLMEDKTDDFTVYGEWIGPGIQKGVAINEIPEKAFVVFCYRDNEDGAIRDFPFFDWKDTKPDPNFEVLVDVPNIFHIDLVPYVTISVDFNNPEACVEDLERWTQKYEDSCPMGELFGIQNGVGEGLVWSLNEIYHMKDENAHRFMFKTKGEKHGNVSAKNANKVKVAVSAEKIEDFNKLLDTILPAWRLEQFYQELADAAAEEGATLDRGSTGALIKAIANDILKEESDIIAASEFEWKVIAPQVANRVRQFFFTKV